MMLPRNDALSWIDEELDALDQQGLRRRLRAHDGPQGSRIAVDGRELVNFGSNDYLALAGDPRLARAANEATAREGTGGGASPLLAGRGESHARLEADLAGFEGAEAAIVFTSGFAANLGAIPPLVARGDAVFGDEMNHASLIDGCRLSRAAVHVYRHADWRQLEQMLAGAAGARRRLIVTDGLFSMDGDLAPLVELTELARRHDALLLVDEAHATGVLGRGGRGACQHFGVEHAVHVRVGTLSKALGGAGGFVCGNRNLIEWLVNRARSYVYSTVPPPAVCAAASMALDIVREEPRRREQLQQKASGLRARLAAQGWNVGESASQIIPLVVGEPQRAVALSDALANRGFYVPAIRPPSVPAGQSRLRIGVGFGHDEAMLAGLEAALAGLATADNGRRTAETRRRGESS
jgi:8-amino-7-oxononanoate synthase